MNNIPMFEFKSFKRLESYFDDAYISLLSKLGQYKEDADDNDQHCENGNSNVDLTKLEQSVDRKDTDSNLKEEGEEEKEDDDDDDDEEDEESVEDSEETITEEPTEGSVGEEETKCFDEQDESALSLQPELATLALCFAKLMTKSLLSVERATALEQQVRQLERENCTLRAIAKNCHELCSPQFLKDKDGDSGQANKRYRRPQTNNSRKATNLIAFKSAIEQEIDDLLDRKNKSTDMLKRKYQTEIFGLKLAVDYLRKELSGRVQQLQLFDRFHRSKTNVDDKMMNQYSVIWNQVLHSIALNRYKTMVRFSNEVCNHMQDDEEPEEKSSVTDLFYSTLINGCKFTDPTLIDNARLGQLRFVSIFLEKNKKIGITIIGGKEFHLPLMIWSIKPNSTASKCGQFAPGDILLSIQTFDMIGASQSYAIQLLKSISGWCRFGIVRIPLTNIENCYENKHGFNFELLYDHFENTDDEEGDEDDKEPIIVDNVRQRRVYDEYEDGDDGEVNKQYSEGEESEHNYSK